MLRIDPLEHKIEAIYGPFFSKDYHPKYTRVVAFSDSSLVINFLWTVEEKDDQGGPKSQMRLPRNMWRSERLEMLANIFYIRLTRPDNDTGEPNKLLILKLCNLKEQTSSSCQTFEKKSNRSLSFTDMEGFPDDNYRHNSTETKRTQSPFRSKLFQTNKTSKVPKVNNKAISVDYRIPEYIPKGAILKGGLNGAISFLPKPQQKDMYLVSTGDDNIFEWRSI